MSRATFKPACREIGPWLRANAFALGALTGTDTRALHAAVHVVELYAYDRDDTLLDAFNAIVHRMQESTRHLAYHAIAYVMDWSDRDAIWEAAGLRPIPEPQRRITRQAS